MGRPLAKFNNAMPFSTGRSSGVTNLRRELNAMGAEGIREAIREKCGGPLVEGLAHELGPKGARCPLCKRSNSPWAYRIVSEAVGAISGGAQAIAELSDALSLAIPAREAVENASSMSNDERRAAVISWLARDQGVPEAAMRVAVFNVRSQAVVVEHSHETNGNGNGNGNGVTP